jgi:hypothetical protein
MSTKLSAGRVRSTYEFIKANRDHHSVLVMCDARQRALLGRRVWAEQAQQTTVRVTTHEQRFTPWRGKSQRS